MGLFDIFKKKTNYKAIMLEEVASIRQRFFLCNKVCDEAENFINQHTEQEWNDYFTNHPENSPKKYLAGGISNIAADVLESGWLHIYRGMLGPEGTQTRELLNSQLDILEQTGQVSKEERAKYERTLADNIRSVG